MVRLVDSLVEAFLAYCISSAKDYRKFDAVGHEQPEPLPRSICRVLYVLCKVRGYKVIIRLLNNEPKYVETILTCFRLWDTRDEGGRAVTTWEERYVMLLWLSHLMLAPFDLYTISGISAKKIDIPVSFLSLQLPEVTKVLLGTALKYVHVPSKEREAASLVITRLALREDMRKAGMLQAAIDWCLADVLADDDSSLDQYKHIGALTLLYSLTNLSSSTTIEPHVSRIFSSCNLLVNNTSEVAKHARESAVTRKLLVKIIRTSILQAVSFEARRSTATGGLLEDVLEDGIQALLEWLSDTDTPVRQAASKALSMVVLKIDIVMATEVIEAVLACMNENMLLQDTSTGQLSAVTDMLNIDLTQYRKNLNAVDPLKWHGAMLTLGHLLFRRSPPPEMLAEILDALLMGLTFEQRSNVGTSVGVAVRDAACFGVWSLARKYTTKEVEAARLPASFFAARQYELNEDCSTLQAIATELVLAACLDPSGNLRRGASAALQELTGRHPDSISQGIPIVQRVDYHAVARRSRALLEVTTEASELETVYHQSLLYQLLGWRCSRAVDADSRRQAALAVGKLFSIAPKETKIAFAKHLISRIQDLKPSNVGSNAAARHGLLLALAAITVGKTDRRTTNNTPQELQAIFRVAFSSLDSLTGSLDGRVTADLIHVLEATAQLLAIAAKKQVLDSRHFQSMAQASDILQVLDRCTTATEDGTVTDAAAAANAAVIRLCSEKEQADFLPGWLPAKLERRRTAFTSKGRLKSLALVYPLIVSLPSSELPKQILVFLTQLVQSELPIETRVSAVTSIETILSVGKYCTAIHHEMLFAAILHGLNDYTSDQRGDVGSLLRLASIDAVRALRSERLQSGSGNQMLQAIIRLAAEKLTKVRAAAWSCLQNIEAQLTTPQLEVDVTSVEYYKELTRRFMAEPTRDALMKGLVSSIGGGAEDVSLTATTALVLFLANLPPAKRSEELQWMIDWLLQQLSRNAEAEDREVVSLLDTLCLILENFSDETEEYLVEQKKKLLILVKALQTSVADIGRIQSLLRLLSILSVFEAYRAENMDLITRKLLHKWPKVRQAAADAIWLNSNDIQRDVDWNLPANANKDAVVSLRKELGIAGRNSGAATSR